MEEQKEQKKASIIDKLLGKKESQEFSAERAWLESTYGEGSFRTVEERIKEKQDYIKSCIKSKFRQICQNGYHGYNSYSAYHCVIDIEEDLADNVEVIFEPFVKNGFHIINLSDQVKEIDEPHVYLVSWKNAFKNEKKSEN